MSDVDAAWITPPYALLNSVPDADVLSGTDCLNVPWDRDRSTRSNTVKNCGHQPGSKWSAWFNTGVMLFRARPVKAAVLDIFLAQPRIHPLAMCSRFESSSLQATIDMMQEWRDLMDSIKGDAQIDDQLTFNQLVGTVWSSGKHSPRFKRFYPLKAASTDGRVVYDGNGTRRIHAVPASVFCSAHVYHVQQSADPRDCIVLHLTFVEGWPKNPAKYWRLREAGLLAVRPEPFNGKYLSFTPPQPLSIPPERNPPDPAKTPDGKGWTVEQVLGWSPRFAAHVDLVDRHIGALRNAIGIARSLGRHLVMPRMLCLCERSEGPFALLPRCVLDGASTPVPHVCPLESVYDVARLEPIWQRNYIQLLPWTFLNSTIHKAPAGAQSIDAASDITTVKWQTCKDTSCVAKGRNPREVLIPRGLSDVQLKEALASTQASEARVLHLDSIEGVFGGFEDRSEASQFEKVIMQEILGGWSATWCCTSWDKPRGTLKFKRPIPLPSGSAARGPRLITDIPAKRDCYWMDRSDCNYVPPH